MTNDVKVRPLNETDLGEILRIDEAISGQYRPDTWERRIAYYLRRDPDSALAAEQNGRLVGFVFGEIRSGEFGFEEPTGWIEVIGVDPTVRGRSVGKQLGEALLERFRSQGATEVRTLIDASLADLELFFISLGFEVAPVKALVKRFGKGVER